MRLREFAGDAATSDANLVTALELLRHRSEDNSTAATIRTDSLINLILNTDKTFNYDALVSANETNPAVKNLIKSFNRDQIILTPLTGTTSSNDTTTNMDVGNQQGQDPVDNVSDMAIRAAKLRGAALSQ
jgi:hypothetical protein